MFKNLISPLVSLLLCIAAVLLPWITFPFIEIPGISSILKLPEWYNAVMSSELALSSTEVFDALKEVFADIGVVGIVLVVGVFLLSLLLLVIAAIFALIALVRGATQNLRKGISNARLSTLFLALSLLTGTLLILGANARLTGDLDRILQSQGIAPPPLTIVAPSLFLWLMLGVAVVGFVVLTIVGRRVRRAENLGQPSATPVPPPSPR